jgi:hypothetical protein
MKSIHVCPIYIPTKQGKKAPNKSKNTVKHPEYSKQPVQKT